MIRATTTVLLTHQQLLLPFTFWFVCWEMSPTYSAVRAHIFCNMIALTKAIYLIQYILENGPHIFCVKKVAVIFSKQGNSVDTHCDDNCQTCLLEIMSIYNYTVFPQKLWWQHNWLDCTHRRHPECFWGWC